MDEIKKSSNKGAVFIVFGALAAVAARLFYFSPKAAENREKAKQLALTAKEEVMKRVEQVQEMNEDRFKEIVDEVTDRYAKLQQVGPRVAAKASRDLKKYWKEIYVEVLSKKK